MQKLCGRISIRVIEVAIYIKKFARYSSLIKFQTGWIYSRRLYRGYFTRVFRFHLFLLIFLISRSGARTNISSQHPHPGLGRNREGDFLSLHRGALFYKYLSSFESIGDRASASPFSASFPLIRCSSRPPHLRDRTLGRVFVLANLLYVSYADLHP